MINLYHIAASKVKTTISSIIGMILLLLISTLIFSLVTMSRVQTNLKIQTHTRTVITGLKDNFIYLLNAETGLRGYVINSDTSFLQPYYLAVQNIPANTALLYALTKDNPRERLQFDTLVNYINQKMSHTTYVVNVKQRGDTAMMRKITAQHNGKRIMDIIRVLSQSMQQEEEMVFQESSKKTNSSLERAKIIFIIEGIIALLATLFLTAVIMNELNRRSRTEKIILANNAELERKNKEIEQFAYIASHDLQEPLRTISNFSMLLTEKLESNPDLLTRQYMSFISGGAQRMSNLIFDLLQYSRIGKDLSLTEIDCNKLVNEILNDLSASIEANKAKIHISKLPVINGYINLKSLFQNLLSNAIKFHKEGAIPVITIGAEDTGNEFHFIVKDNGIGIEKEYNERIFTIFQRLHSRDEFPGTGIGLAQCKKIVELHGGKIWIDSKPGKGTIFNFTIPKK